MEKDADYKWIKDIVNRLHYRISNLEKVFKYREDMYKAQIDDLRTEILILKNEYNLNNRDGKD